MARGTNELGRTDEAMETLEARPINARIRIFPYTSTRYRFRAGEYFFTTAGNFRDAEETLIAAITKLGRPLLLLRASLSTARHGTSNTQELYEGGGREVQNYMALARLQSYEPANKPSNEKT